MILTQTLGDLTSMLIPGSGLITNETDIKHYLHNVDGLVQERCNSNALALEICLSCTNPSISSSYLSHSFCFCPMFEWHLPTTFNWPWICALSFNTLRPGQDGCQFPEGIFKYIFLNENIWISIEISLKFVLKGPINNIPALVQIMAWCRPDDMPLSELMMISLLMHICITWA